MATKVKNYIIFSSIDWTIHWQLHHQLATSLVTSGNRVLFVDNTGIRSVNVSDISRLSERIVNWWNGTHGFSYIDNSLTVYSPLLLPFPYSKISLFINKIIFNKSLSKWIKAAKFIDPVVISFLPTPLISQAVKSVNPKLTVYYCANNMADSSTSASQVLLFEKQFFKDVDIVFTASNIAQEYASKFSKNVFYFPPGIDFEKFNIEKDNNIKPLDDMVNISGPIIGYVGTLGRVLDQSLLCNVADKCPDFTIVLIGPEYTNINTLKNRKNIILLGSKSHDLLPYYIDKFDVGIVPYVCNDFTEGVYPSKLNEYLAMGVPFVSTNLREVRESMSSHAGVGIIANNTREFIDGIKNLVKEKDIEFKELRRRVAKENSWDSRFKGISEILNSYIDFKEDEAPKNDWRKRFDGCFKRSKLYKKIVLLTLLLYLVIFYTPLFWLLGEQLVVQGEIKKSDVILVFGGYGEANYKNFAFKKRVDIAVDLYEKGYSNKIYLFSGVRHEISENNIMDSLLQKKGIPKENIFLGGNSVSNTYESVMESADLFEKNKINSVLLVTSRYHTLRAVLSWNKHKPKYEIIPVTANQTSRVPQWNLKIGQIKVIFYEYVALVHNWLLSRI